MADYYSIISYYWLVFSLSILIIILAKYRKETWGKMIAAGFSIVVVLHIYSIVEQIFHRNFSYGRPQVIYQLISSFYVFASILEFLGIASIPIWRQTTISRDDIMQQNNFPMQLKYKRRNLTITILLLIVTLNVYWLFWLYNNTKELKQLNSKWLNFSAGQAVGFLFIPLFNIYWLINVFVRFPRAVGELRNQLYANKPGSDFSSGLVSIFLILSFLTNGIIAGFDRMFFLIGGVLFITTVVYTQNAINQTWDRVKSLQTESRNVTSTV